MARASREKGARGEREVAALFRSRGFDCERVPNSGGLRIKGDLDGNTGLHTEVKRGEAIRWWQSWAQATAEAPPGKLPLLAVRSNRTEWLAVLRLEDFVRLWAALGVYGRQHVRSGL